jgi:hypothetical protein
LIDSDNLVVTLNGSHPSEVGKNPAKQPVATKTSGESLRVFGFTASWRWSRLVTRGHSDQSRAPSTT